MYISIFNFIQLRSHEGDAIDCFDQELDTNHTLNLKKNNTSILQGCQLPDFSLRSQTFCYTVAFSTTFLYMLKTKICLHIPSQNHQQAP